jgi:hypothetical protein
MVFPVSHRDQRDSSRAFVRPRTSAIFHLLLHSRELFWVPRIEHVKKETVMSMIDPKGAQPEALAKFAEVSRNDNGEPVKNGVLADQETAAIPTDPKLKQDAATKVLREGVTHKSQGAKQAINKLPDRTAKK